MMKNAIGLAWFLGTVLVGNAIGGIEYLIAAHYLDEDATIGWIVATIIIAGSVLFFWRGSIFLLQGIAARLERSPPS